MEIGDHGQHGAHTVTMEEPIQGGGHVIIHRHLMVVVIVLVVELIIDRVMELVMEVGHVVQYPVHVMLVRETVTEILIVKEIWCVDITIVQ